MNFLLDDSGDLAVSNNVVQTVEGVDEIGQMIAVRLKKFSGEWFLDATGGVPWFSKIFIKNPNPAEIESILMQTIIETPGVISLSSFELSLDKKTRKLQVVFSAKTVSGQLNFSEIVP